MKLRLWPRRKRVRPAREPATEEPTRLPEPRPAPETEQPTPPEAQPRQPASAFARPSSPGEKKIPALPDELPAKASLTLDEAKTAIRAAGGDVIQVGFLASAYLRHRDDEPESKETAAARERFCELVAKRLKDRKLLAPEGTFELLEEP